ncbi:MAG TPA: hypothetical protein VK335_13335 [Bryobacteraceae bacterium]|nr:hypothetical protein [Bryobacteraceae bacterium]
MIRTPHTTLLSLCLFLPFQAAPAFAQQTSTGTAQQQPAPAPSQKPAPAAQPETPLNTSDAQLSLQLFYWMPIDQPDLRGGAANVGPYPGSLNYPGTPKRAPGAVVSIPAGRNNTIRVSYFRIQGDGNTSAHANLTLFNTDYAPGDYLVTRYNLQNVKISYDFLSYPYPANPARFRLKTLWEVQYTTIQSSIDAPLKPVLTDASGNPISNTAAGTRNLIYPTLGLAIEKALNAHFRVEAKASGFAIPHHATIYDAEASAVYRTGRYEVAVGAKAFHFKTSTQNSQYVLATFPGAFVAIRYYPKWLW